MLAMLARFGAIYDEVIYILYRSLYRLGWGFAAAVQTFANVNREQNMIFCILFTIPTLRKALFHKDCSLFGKLSKSMFFCRYFHIDSLSNLMSNMV